jgi:hypothetical protein
MGRESFSLPTPTALGLCISPSGVSMVVFGCLFLCNFRRDCNPFGAISCNEDALCLLKKKKKQITENPNPNKRGTNYKV